MIDITIGFYIHCFYALEITPNIELDLLTHTKFCILGVW